MTFNPEQKAALAAPLNSAHVSSRNQAGRSLSYIEGWHAIAEANRIFGFDAWDRETVMERCVSEKTRKIGQQQKDGWSVSYIAKVRVTVDGRTREGIGAGHGIDVDLGLAHESAVKEAETDAMKRALMTFGNPFGLALYDKTQANVVDDKPEPRKAALAPSQAPKTYSHYLTHITNAETETGLKAIFAELWRDASLSETDKASLKEGYEAKKIKLTEGVNA